MPGGLRQGILFQIQIERIGMSLEAQENGNDGMLIATFMLGDAVFGIQANYVHEVVRVGDITMVHKAPAGIVGIRNLRGRIITVIDLSVKLQLGSVHIGPDSRILIVEIQNEAIGLLVDSIAEIVTVTTDEISEAPPILNEEQSKAVTGVVYKGERLIALLDPVVILNTDIKTVEGSSRERS
jgi:purine-binding chemotaxis protein CheW